MKERASIPRTVIMSTKGMSAGELERRRRLAVDRIREGKKQTEVAQFLGVNVRTIRRWMHEFRQAGAAGLAARPRQGAKPKLTLAQEKEVLSWFWKSPRELGLKTDLWTGRQIVALIQQKFRVRMNPNYICSWLAKRRITRQKPRRKPRERREEDIKHWLRSDWPRIQSQAVIEKAHVVLIDESGALLLPLVRRTWAPRGRPPQMRYRAKHRQRVSMAAALGLSPLQRRCTLHFRTYRNSYVNQEREADFLKALLHQIRGRIIVVWDGGPMHRGEYIREVLARHPRLTIERLPPYAPDLNPVEALWNHLKYHELANFTPDNVADLQVQLVTRLRNAQRSQHRIRSFLKATPLTTGRRLSI
jgi:transposase